MLKPYCDTCAQLEGDYVAKGVAFFQKFRFLLYAKYLTHHFRNLYFRKTTLKGFENRISLKLSFSSN